MQINFSLFHLMQYHHFRFQKPTSPCLAMGGPKSEPDRETLFKRLDRAPKTPKLKRHSRKSRRGRPEVQRAQTLSCEQIAQLRTNPRIVNPKVLRYWLKVLLRFSQ